MIANKELIKMYLENPKPNAHHLIRVLQGLETSQQVLPMELIIDDEILAQYCQTYLHREWISYQRVDLKKRALYWDNVIECYYRLGYSGLRVSNALMFDIATNNILDTATLSRGERKWSNHQGKIHDIESFNTYPWPSENQIDVWDYEYVNAHLPEGMGIFACIYGGIFEMLCEYLVGFEEMSYMMIDDEPLLSNIFSKVGDLLYLAYEKVIKLDRVVCLFQGDDLGYTQGLMFSPSFYRSYVFPWHQRCIQLAHQHQKAYILHSCGNLRQIKQDLIDLKIDAKHSFEDKGWSVFDFYDEMHEYMGIIGGVDMDKLCRMETVEFQIYCTQILNHCHKHGRYAYGSGNSIANYVPLDKFLLMLKIGHEFSIREDKDE